MFSSLPIRKWTASPFHPAEPRLDVGADLLERRADVRPAVGIVDRRRDVKSRRVVCHQALALRSPSASPARRCSVPDPFIRTRAGRGAFTPLQSSKSRAGPSRGSLTALAAASQPASESGERRMMGIEGAPGVTDSRPAAAGTLGGGPRGESPAAIAEARLRGWVDGGQVLRASAERRAGPGPPPSPCHRRCVPESGLGIASAATCPCRGDRRIAGVVGLDDCDDERRVGSVRSARLSRDSCSARTRWAQSLRTPGRPAGEMIEPRRVQDCRHIKYSTFRFAMGRLFSPHQYGGSGVRAAGPPRPKSGHHGGTLPSAGSFLGGALARDLMVPDRARLGHPSRDAYQQHENRQSPASPPEPPFFGLSEFRLIAQLTHKPLQRGRRGPVPRNASKTLRLLMIIRVDAIPHLSGIMCRRKLFVYLIFHGREFGHLGRIRISMPAGGFEPRPGGTASRRLSAGCSQRIS